VKWDGFRALVSSLVILCFETEDDYRKGNEALNALPAGDNSRAAHLRQEVQGDQPPDRLGEIGSTAFDLV
jgi:hypothetical protein